MSNALPWIALVVSILSAAFAGSAWWISREKLRLDLYDRRFGVYLRTLDFWYALSDWKPTDNERHSTTLQDSPELRTAQIAFIKASREAQFLFDDASGIHKLLEQVHSDSIGVVGYKRDIAHHPAEPQQVITNYNEKEVRRQRFDDAIPLLEQKLAKYLDFHSLSAWDDSDY
jgi:hypothetical protein